MAHNNLPEMPASPVLELYGQRKRLTVPIGLKCLLEEMSREVLRSQPPNIYEFLADYLNDKLQKQCGTEHQERKSWEWRKWSWEGSSLLTDDDLMEFLERHHLTFSEANRLAVIIQAAYRGFRDRIKVKHLKKTLHDDLEIEYDGENAYFVYDSNGQIIRFTADDMERVLTDYNLTQDEANKYAVKIQKTFRGYRTRESFARDFPELALRLQALEKKEIEKEAEKHAAKEVVENKDLHEHATKIQSLFRGYKARKDFEKLKADSKNKYAEYQGEGEEEYYEYYEE